MKYGHDGFMSCMKSVTYHDISSNNKVKCNEVEYVCLLHGLGLESAGCSFRPYC